MFLNLARLAIGGLAFSIAVEARLERRKHSERDAHSPVNRTLSWGSDPQELVKRDGTKYVFMHHIVGNTYPYSAQDWENDIRDIQAKGVDALALNIGSADWQRTQVAAAYSAAQRLGTNFKLFFSFDFTELPCDAGDIIARANVFRNHPNQFKVNGKTFVSSFSGDCLGNSGWQRVKNEVNAYIMPFIWGQENNYGSWPALDSWYCWGCAWPQGNWEKTIADDNYYINQLGSRYATTVSMWMFTHFGYKNFYLRGDNWLLNNRWEQLVGLRDKLTFVEMLTWNDYGESDYFGPIRGAQPAGTYWADQFPHTAWFDMSEYYIRAFKTGSYPAITKDTIYYWARPHPARAIATSDSVGRPSGWDWAEDFLWASVFATSPATVTLRIGASSQTFNVQAGVSKLKIPTSAGQISVRMVRGGSTVIDKTENGFTFVNVPSRYNYNAFVGSASGGTVTNPTTTSSPTTTTTTAPSSTSTLVVGGITWAYKGCYHDDSNARTIPNGLFVQDWSTNTRANCLARCNSQGYAFGGVEWGVECFCGTQMRAGVSVAPESECDQSCSGNGNEKCGSGGRINVWNRLTSTGPTTTATTTSSITTTSTTPTAPATTTSVGGIAWTYRGCYPDNTDARTIYDGLFLVDTTGNSISKCLSSCSSRGFAFGGVEYGQECFCGTRIRAGVNPVSESDCNQACTGNANEKCGAGGRLNIYSRSLTSTTTTQTSSPTSISTSSTRTSTASTTPSSAPTLPPATVTGFAHQGCVAEGTTGSRRALTGAAYTRSDMTPGVCQGLCSHFLYFGVEHGNECYCGNTLSNGATGRLIEASQCGSRCAGDASQRCGGGWTMDLYLKAAVTWTNLGCHIDSADRMLRGYETSQAGMTVERCLAICGDRGLKISALEYGRECYCGNELLKGGSGNMGAKTAEGECNTPCDGNAAQTCGAGWRGNVYALPS